MSDTFVHQGAGAGRVWYTIDDSGVCVVLRVGGQIDAHNCAGVCDAVSVAGGFSSGLVIDLTQADFTEATAAGLVVRALQRCLGQRTTAAVVSPPEPVDRLLAASDLGGVVSVQASVTEAIASVSRSAHDPVLS